MDADHFPLKHEGESSGGIIVQPLGGHRFSWQLSSCMNAVISAGCHSQIPSQSNERCGSLRGLG